MSERIITFHRNKGIESIEIVAICVKTTSMKFQDAQSVAQATYDAIAAWAKDKEDWKEGMA